MSVQKRAYPFLDGFRAVAILMVLADHVRLNFHLNRWLANNTTVFHWLNSKSGYFSGIDTNDFYLWVQGGLFKIKGVLGVQIFFVLSGFFITRILIKDKDSGKGFSIGRFYLRRFLKIYPSYLLLLVVSFFVFDWQNPQPLAVLAKQAVQYMFFLQNYFFRNPLLEHTWSLVVTEQFYIFCPLVILAVYMLFPSARARRVALLGICFALMAAVTLIRGYYLDTGKTFIAWPLHSPFPFLTTLYHSDSLCFGCMLALLEPYWSNWPKKKLWGYLFGAVGYIGYYYLFFHKYWNFYLGPWYFYTLGYVMFGCLFMASYHGVSLLVHREFMQWIGRNSYGIYLWHCLVFQLATWWVGKIPTALLIIGCCLVSLACGVLSTITVERYFLSLRDKMPMVVLSRQALRRPAWVAKVGVCAVLGFFIFSFFNSSRPGKAITGAQGWIQQGVAEIDRGNPQLAVKDFSKAIELDTSNAQAYNDRGILYYYQGKTDAAIADYKKALSIVPDNAIVYYNLGVVSQDKHDLNRAIADYSKAIEFNPEFAHAYNNLGTAYQEKGDLFQARADYDYALLIDPGIATVYANRAVVFFLNKRYDRAWQDVRKSQSLGCKVNEDLLNDLKVYSL